MPERMKRDTASAEEGRRNAAPTPFRLPGGLPVPWLVLGVPLVAIALVAILVALRPATVPGDGAHEIARAELLFEDRPDGSVAVRRRPDEAMVATLDPATNAFVRVTLAGLVRERRRDHRADRSAPFVVTRWSDGRLTLDDGSGRRPIELASFGPDNAAAFARLLDAASRVPARPDATDPR